LWVLLAANIALVGVLIAVGITAHSLSVWAEGADYLGDAAAIGVSLLAINLARRPPTPRRPSGFPNATRVAAAVNAGWLLTLSLLVAAGAVTRLASGSHRVHGLPVLVVSSVAAVVMLAGALLLGGDLDDDDDSDDAGEGHELNLRAVALDTAADAAAAAGVAATGGIIFATGGNYWLDPAVALLIATAVGYHSARLLIRVRDSLYRRKVPT
jgi:cobalt-zinc-cadmium efflux system protein